MTPEAGSFLDKAQKLLLEAEAMLAIRLNAAAGRTAYLAGYHAAQALISERTGRSVKTHKGVHTEFHRLTRDDPHFDQATRAHLSQSYNLKSIADYDTGPDAEVSAERAAAALADGKRFVAQIDRLLHDT